MCVSFFTALSYESVGFLMRFMGCLCLYVCLMDARSMFWCGLPSCPRAFQASRINGVHQFGSGILAQDASSKVLTRKQKIHNIPYLILTNN